MMMMMVMELRLVSLIFTILVSLTCHASAAPRSSSSSSSSGTKGATFPANGFKRTISGSSSLSSSSFPYNLGSRKRVNSHHASQTASGLPRASQSASSSSVSLFSARLQDEGNKITQEINKLAQDLQDRRIQLSTARDRHRQLSKKLKAMIKKARKKRLYFFDTLLLKTLKYNRAYLKRIKEQLSRIDSTNDLLTSGSSNSSSKRKKKKSKTTLRDFEAKHIMKQISQQNLVSDSDQIVADSSKRLLLLNSVLDDMIREKNLI